MSDTEQKPEKKKKKSDNERINRSKQMARVLKRDWTELQTKQRNSGQRISAGQKISNVDLRKNEKGEVFVKVTTENGGTIRHTEKRSTFHSFKERAQELSSRSRIEDFMRKIQAHGWHAVQGDIPPELKEAVLTACQKANISVSTKGEKEEQSQKAIKANLAKQKAAEQPPPPSTFFQPPEKPSHHKPPKTPYKNNIESVKKRNEHTESVTAEIRIGQTKVKVNGDRPLQADAILREAEALFKKKESGKPLTPQEQARLDLWAKKGINNLNDLKTRGGKITAQISTRGMTGAFAEQMKQAKKLEQQKRIEKLVNPHNKETALKKQQIRLVLKKHELGIKLSKEEAFLFESVQKFAKTSEAFEKLSDAKLAQLLEQKRRYLKGKDTPFLDVSKQLQDLKKNPELYKKNAKKKAYKMPVQRKVVDLDIKAGMTLEELKAKKSALKETSIISKESSKKRDLLQLYGKMHGIDVVDEKGLAWVEKNLDNAHILLKERGVIKRIEAEKGRELSPKEVCKRIEKLAKEARENPEAFKTPSRSERAKAQNAEKAAKEGKSEQNKQGKNEKGPAKTKAEKQKEVQEILNHKDSAAKIDMMKSLLEKAENGEKIPAHQQPLMNFLQTQHKLNTSDDLESISENKLAEILRCKKHFAQAQGQDKALSQAKEAQKAPVAKNAKEAEKTSASKATKESTEKAPVAKSAKEAEKEALIERIEEKKKAYQKRQETQSKPKAQEGAQKEEETSTPKRTKSLQKSIAEKAEPTKTQEATKEAIKATPEVVKETPKATKKQEKPEAIKEPAKTQEAKKETVKQTPEATKPAKKKQSLQEKIAAKSTSTPQATTEKTADKAPTSPTPAKQATSGKRTGFSAKQLAEIQRDQASR